MLKLDRYIASEFLQSIFAALIILTMVMVGGAFMDVLKDVTKGTMPAGMMLAQLGLVMLTWLPLILPLALMLGILLGMSRLYRDAEMPVLASIGVGPKRLLRPLMMVVLPCVAVVALCALWLGPWAERYSRGMIQEANRNLLITGLEPGKFVAMPGNDGVVYVAGMSNGGSEFDHVFIYREKNDRIHVTTAPKGTLKVEGPNSRFLSLKDGFEVEGPLDNTQLNYRLLQYETNDVRMPDRDDGKADADLRRKPTMELLKIPGKESNAQVHWRLAPAFLALALALLAVPLARSPPRQQRYGRIVVGFLGYFIATDLMILGTQWLSRGKLPRAAGLWWLTLPLLGLAIWMYMRDGKLGKVRA
jgi:lipopolysaccharide export system permease protein